MTATRILSLLATVGLSAVAFGQSPAMPSQSGPSPHSSVPSSDMPTAPSATPDPANPDSTGPSSRMPDESTPGTMSPRGMPPTTSSESPAAANPDPTTSSGHGRDSTRIAAAHNKALSSGMSVRSPSGQSLGSVVAMVPGRSGETRDGYVVIAGSGGQGTPVPYSVASSMVENGAVTLDRSRLERAPKIPQSQLEDRSSTSWQSKVDSYWGSSASHGQSMDTMPGAGERSAPAGGGDTPRDPDKR